MHPEAFASKGRKSRRPVLGEDVGDFELGEFYRAVEGINLPSIPGWLIQNRRNDPSLIRRRDGRIASFAKRKRKNVFLPNGLRLIHQPFGKERGAQMSDRNS
jgi:hypothetical protein